MGTIPDIAVASLLASELDVAIHLQLIPALNDYDAFWEICLLLSKIVHLMFQFNTSVKFTA